MKCNIEFCECMYTFVLQKTNPKFGISHVAQVTQSSYRYSQYDIFQNKIDLTENKSQKFWFGNFERINFISRYLELVELNTSEKTRKQLKEIKTSAIYPKQRKKCVGRGGRGGGGQVERRQSWTSCFFCYITAHRCVENPRKARTGEGWATQVLEN